MLKFPGGKAGKRQEYRTCVLVVQLQKVALLVELIGMAVEKRKDRLQLGDSVFVDIHDRRLVGVDHGQWTGAVALVRWAVDRRCVYRAAIVWASWRRCRAIEGDLGVGKGIGGARLGVRSRGAVWRRR